VDEQASLRVMLVDDHKIFRASLKLLLEKSGCTVVAEAASAEEAMTIVGRSRPQIVLMDLEMPGTDGLSATRRLRRALPQVRVIFLSAHDEEKDVIEALTQAGAAGYLLKSDAPEELIGAVRAVHEGKRYLSPSIAPMLLRHLGNPADTRDESSLLTTREREVLRLVSQGATSKEIAQQLGISPKTAQVHRDNLKQKLNLRTTAEMVQWAIRHKIIR
jgi:two-component system response regulator NreC